MGLIYAQPVLRKDGQMADRRWSAPLERYDLRMRGLPSMQLLASLPGGLFTQTNATSDALGSEAAEYCETRLLWMLRTPTPRLYFSAGRSVAAYPAFRIIYVSACSNVQQCVLSALIAVRVSGQLCGGCMWRRLSPATTSEKWQAAETKA